MDSAPSVGQVFQRNPTDKAHIHAAGRILGADNCVLQFRVCRRNQSVKGLDWHPVALDAERRWNVSATLPVGGPFELQWRLADDQNELLDERSIRELFVGDLWILAGQSNMDGCGLLGDAECELPSESVRVFSLANEWSVAEDPLHDCNEAIYSVYRTTYAPHSSGGRLPIDYHRRGPWPDYQNERTQGVGLGVSFGKRILEQTRIPIGLVPCSLGGSTLAEWRPELREDGEHSLYGALLLRLQEIGGEIAGVLWYQGESEGTNSGYLQAMQRLIRTIRQDCHNSHLPFYVVQLAPTGVDQPEQALERSRIRNSQRLLKNHANTKVASAIDLTLMPDSVHLDTPSYVRLGNRLANIALAHAYQCSSYDSGPEPTDVLRDPTNPNVLTIKFSGVNGVLHKVNENLPAFSLRNDVGIMLEPAFVKCDVSENGRTIILQADATIPKSARLWYAFGTHPTASITDDRDMALPAFGPLEILLASVGTRE